MSLRSCSQLVLVVAWLAAFAAPAPASLVIFDWAMVGNAGNAADPLNSASVPGIGSVDYQYRIATTEVTNAQYTVFLNAVDAAGTNPHGVYNSFMGSSDPHGGISFNAGAPSGSKYAVKANMGNKPVTYVSFFDAMRFVNWLDNGQGAGGTENGAYNISDGVSETRADGAQFFIPTENEWYKAAYHQPAAQGGDGDNYWRYPTASNSIPTIASATAIGDISNPGANVANYATGAHWNGQTGNMTTVGSAGSLSASFYGTFDQGGNVWEWNETLVQNSTRGVRGGSWINDENDLRSSTRLEYSPGTEDTNLFGFRVASPVPEPCTLSLLALGALQVLCRNRRH